MHEAGEKLKKIRLAKGLTLEEVQKKTKIHLSILKAIEGEGLTNLNPVYLKGFVKIYCKFLGLDPKECIPDYQDNPQAFSVHQIEEEHAQPKPVAEIKSSSSRGPAFSLPFDLKKIIIVVLAVFVVIFTFYNLGKFISSRKKAEPAAAAVEAQKSNPQPAKMQTTAPARPSEIPSVVRLTVIARENCMVTVKVDGKVYRQGLIAKGRSDSWKAKDRIELSLTNAGGVELIVNSQRFPNIGKKKQKINNIIIDKQGLHIPR
ncbi:MAG: DUF4115 domain-containing protein [Candidatus Omnitrophica bacterium]|nr:DUF4115 domain-containing protein [Candidatus Omnitrophota bacterium]